MTVLPTFDPGFSTPEMTEVFDPDHRIKALLAFEAALVEAEAKAGLIPAAAASEIVRACSEFAGDSTTVIASTWETGSPLIALLDGIKEQLTDESARWVHHGATTQDAVDTASMLQSKAGLAVLDRGVSSVAGRLAELADVHHATPMMGRTFLQAARPTTFGVRVAQWLEPLVRALIDLREVSTSLPVQLGGPVGNLAPFGDAGTRVVETLAARLSLKVPVIPWHTDRSHVIRPVAVAETIAIAMGKIGTDLALLAQSEVAELKMRPGASSSMDHKRNPIDAIRAVAAAGACSRRRLRTAKRPWTRTRTRRRRVAPRMVGGPPRFSGCSSLGGGDRCGARQPRSGYRTHEKPGRGDRRCDSGRGRCTGRQGARRNQGGLVTPTDQGTVGNDGVRIAWQSFGGDDRPVIVFSHSLGLDSSAWRPQVEALVDDFRIVAVDTRGHGNSTMSSEAFTLDHLAGDVLAAATAAGADRFHLCGISMGGQIAMWTAINRPERLRSIVVANTAARIGNEQSWGERAGRNQVRRDGGDHGSLEEAVLLARLPGPAPRMVRGNDRHSRIVRPGRLPRLLRDARTQRSERRCCGDQPAHSDHRRRTRPDGQCGPGPLAP